MITVDQRRRALVLLAASFSAVSTVGGFVLFNFWQSRGASDVAVARLVLFVALMAAVHGIGAALFFAQGENASIRQAPAMPVLRKSVWAAVAQYIVLLWITALILDGGFICGCFILGMLVHAAIVGIICSRRAGSPSTVDLALIRYGYLPIAILTVQATAFLRQWSVS